MNDIDLAQSLFKKPAEVVKEAFGGRLPTYTVEAEAMADSEGGFVQVQFMGDTVNLTDGDPDGAGDVTDEAAESGEAAQWVEVPCSACIHAGDRVLVTIQDGAPIDCTAIGFGDALGAVADAAATLAQQAETLAQATAQNFWHDANGAHVSTTANDAEGERNILMNAYGILLRAYANYLAALTSSGVAFYDGNGNAASNIVAAFGSSGAQIGKTGETHIAIDPDSVDVLDGNGNVLFTMGTDGSAAVLRSLLKYASFGINAGTSDYAETYVTRDTGNSQLQNTVYRPNGSYVCNARHEAYVEDGAESHSLISAEYTTLAGTSHKAEITARATGNAGYANADADKVTVNSSAALVQETKQATISSTAAGNNATGSFSIAKTGYTPIAAQWWWSAGTRQNFFNDYGCHFEGNTYYYRFCNVGSSAANGTLQVQVTYARTELL